MSEVTKLIHKYLRHDKKFPHVWCPGCGIGILLGALIRAIDRTGLEKDDIVLVSGIGCSGRLPVYVDFNTLHTTHGRALTFATGVKLAKPSLKVIVVMGDGDAVAIGGNHFIHAARRNVDMTVLCVNNFTYGMTGGQLGPTTPLTACTATTRRGNTEKPFNIPYLAAASGAVYVARWTAAQVHRLEQTMTEALAKKGFSVVEIISPCPTYYGRMNRQVTGLEQMRYYRDSSVVKHGINPAEADIEINGQIVVGKFVDIERPAFGELQQNMLQKVVPKPSTSSEAAIKPALLTRK